MTDVSLLVNVTMKDFTGKLSVIMPAYNEEGLILHSIQETRAFLDSVGCDYEIIVVDDGSQDATQENATKADPAARRVKVLGYDLNMGKGHALKYGFQYATGDLVAFLDADLDLHPRQLATLYQVMRRSQADVVIGSKQHPLSKVDYPWHRKLVSTVFFWLVHILFGLHIHDTQTGIKLFKYRVLRDAFPRLRVRRYAFDLELLVAASRFGYKIAEAPVTIRFRRGRWGRIGLKAIAATWLDTMKIFYRASFWKWLNPGLKIKTWMLVFVIGVVAFTWGLTHILMRLSLPSMIATVTYYASLHFVNPVWRDWAFVALGVVIIATALLQLNKYVLAAFARVDDGDLAGIIRRFNNGINETVDLAVNNQGQVSIRDPMQYTLGEARFEQKVTEGICDHPSQRRQCLYP